MKTEKLQEFGEKYTAAWCSRNAVKVASFFAEDGSMRDNEGPLHEGREAIAESAQSFMTTIPDLVLTMDGIEVEGDHIIYRWTLIGTNSGPGGNGKSVHISGHEKWKVGTDGLIVEGNGYFDEAEYKRQLEMGFDGGA